MKIAVQGFSLRDELNEDFPGTMDYLCDNGFEAYEMGIYFGEGPGGGVVPRFFQQGLRRDSH